MTHAFRQEQFLTAAASAPQSLARSPAAAATAATNNITTPTHNTSPTEALVVEALTSMVVQQPLSASLPQTPNTTTTTVSNVTTPLLLAETTPTRNHPSSLVSETTTEKEATTRCLPPSATPKAASASVLHDKADKQDTSPPVMCLPVQTTEPVSREVPQQSAAPAAVPETIITPSGTETSVQNTKSTATSTTSATTTPSGKKSTICTKPTTKQGHQNHPLLPVRDRQVPRRLSPAARRRLLSAPLPRPCLTHKPTLRELQSITFADYVQKVVLGSAVPCDEENDDDDDTDEDNDEEHKKNAVDTDEDSDQEQWKTKPMPLAEGIAKVTLPKGFWVTEGTSWTQGDRTGRGPAWQSGTPLGDYRIEAPIAQHVRGLAGVYEFSFMDKGPVTLAEFRQKADEYRQQVVGCAYDVFEENMQTDKAAESNCMKQDKNAPSREKGEENTTKNEKDNSKTKESSSTPKPRNVFVNEEERLEYLERYFWKRLGPTMPPAWYGADHEGTLFPEDDDATGWSLGQLDSCLHVLPKVPGVTSPYLYAGMWASVFCAHSEDMNLLSINYLHAGAPKIWYAIAPGPDAQRFESLCASSFAGTPSTMGCKEFLRHKRSLLSPKVLLKAGIKYTTAIQRPGDAIITFPAGYHFGFNSGFNIAEATNFGVPEWIPFGWQARVCLCRPDSVRIDMNRLTTLLEEFDQDQSRWRRKRLSWKEWSAQRHCKRQSLQQQPERKSKRPVPGKKTKRKVALSEQQKKREFWIEVAKPLARKSKPAAKAPASKKEKTAEPEEAGRGKRKRKLTPKAAKWEREQLRKKVVEAAPKKPSVVVEEIWHLAKPLPRKNVAVGLRVLCLLPGTTMGYAPKNQWRAGTVDEPQGRQNEMDEDDDFENDRGRQRKHVTDDEEEKEEQCFTGHIVEISDDHARIHIDGLPRSEDVWMDLSNHKVFLDGGRWDEEEEAQDDGAGRSLPQLHYWQEMDSKRRCL